MYVLGDVSATYSFTGASIEEAIDRFYSHQVARSCWIIGQSSLPRRKQQAIASGRRQLPRTEAAYYQHHPSMKALFARKLTLLDKWDYTTFGRTLEQITTAGYAEDINLVNLYFIDTIEYDKLLCCDELEQDDRLALETRLRQMATATRRNLDYLAQERQARQAIAKDMATQADLLTPLMKEEKRCDLKARVQQLLNRPR